MINIKTALINASHVRIADFGTSKYEIDAIWEEHMLRGDEDFCVIIKCEAGHAHTLTFDEICLMVENEMDDAIEFLNQ